MNGKNEISDWNFITFAIILCFAFYLSSTATKIKDTVDLQKNLTLAQNAKLDQVCEILKSIDNEEGLRRSEIKHLINRTPQEKK